MTAQRNVFFISDGTAITAEVLGHAVLSQFAIGLHSVTLPFVENVQRAQAITAQINAIYQQSGLRPLVFFSIVSRQIKEIILQSEGFCQDIVQTLVAPLQQELGIAPCAIAHRTHGLTAGNLMKYDARIAAIDYTLAHDDGITLRGLEQARVILLGVSRCGKTPTSLYLAMQFGVPTANYPFIADDMDNLTLPDALKAHQQKLFGLTIDPERLSTIRHARSGTTLYASIRQCRLEVSEVEILFRSHHIPCLNSTNNSVEEIATKIIDMMGLNRSVF